MSIRVFGITKIHILLNGMWRDSYGK